MSFGMVQIRRTFRKCNRKCVCELVHAEIFFVSCYYFSIQFAVWSVNLQRQTRGKFKVLIVQEFSFFFIITLRTVWLDFKGAMFNVNRNLFSAFLLTFHNFRLNNLEPWKDTQRVKMIHVFTLKFTLNTLGVFTTNSTSRGGDVKWPPVVYFKKRYTSISQQQEEIGYIDDIVSIMRQRHRKSGPSH